VLETSKDRFIRLPEVLHKTALSKPTIYKLIAAGHFPKQIKISVKCSAWSLMEVHKWLEDKKLSRLNAA